jgi:hypothetical protein
MDEIIKPLLLISGAEFIEQMPPKIAIRCDCRQPFSFDPRTESLKICPACKQKFSHFLLIAPVEDLGIWEDAADHILGPEPEPSAEPEPEPDHEK